MIVIASASAQQPEVPKERGPAREIRRVAILPDSSKIVAAFGSPKEKGVIVLWDIAKREKLWSHAEDDGISGMAVSPDGKTLAIGTFASKAKTLDAAAGTPLKSLDGHTKPARIFEFSPDGSLIATTSTDKTVRLWDTVTGEQKAEFDWPTEDDQGIGFSPSGDRLVGYSDNVVLWDVRSAKEIRTMKVGRYSRAAAFITDDFFFTCNNDSRLHICNASREESPILMSNAVYCERFAYSHSSKLLATSYYFGFDIELHCLTLDPPTAEEKARIDKLTRLLDDNDYEKREKAGEELSSIGLVAEPTLRRLAKESASVEVRIRCRRLRDGLFAKSRVTLSGHKERIVWLAFSADGRQLVSSSQDGTIRIWNVSIGRETARFAAEELIGR